MKTKAVVFPEVDKFEVREITLPEVGANDILVRTLVTAISPGTERWFLRGRHIGVEFPLIPGYHRIGIVEKRGEDVSEFEVGDIVYGSAGRWEENIQSQFGAHVGYSVADASGYDFVASETPSKFELETLAFTILIGVANRGVRALEPKATERMVIIGGGIIGICAAQLAMLEGAVPVIVEKDPERLEFIKGIVPNVVSPDDAQFDEKLKEIAPSGFDYLYDSVGHAPTTDRLVQLTRNHGTMMMQAQYFDKEKCAIDMDQVKIKEITIKTTCGIDAKDRLDTVNNILTRRLKVASLITHRFDSDDILKGYELLHTGKPFNLGIVFHWSE